MRTPHYSFGWPTRAGTYNPKDGMALLGSGLTRRILRFALNLHRRAYVSECVELDRRADSMLAAVHYQEKVVAAEHKRLEAIRLASVKAEQEADAAWQAIASEFEQYLPDSNHTTLKGTQA